MKRFVVGLMLAVAGAGFSGATATASNGASHTNFAVTYPGSPGTTWVCSGTRLVNHGIGTRDKETCLISGDLTGFSNGTFSSDPKLTGTVPQCPPSAGVGFVFGIATCWSSDFDGAIATSWTQKFTDNRTVPDTFTFRTTAFYNP